MEANVRISRLGTGAVLAGALLVIGAGWPAVPATVRGLRSPTTWVDRIGADGAAARLALLVLVVLAGWVALGLAAALLARLPGALGQAADRCARIVLPRALYRLAAGAAGVGIVLTPAASALAAPPPAPAAASADPSPAWPSDAPLPAPAWPTGGSVAATARAARNAPPTPTPTPTPAPHHTVVVRPGDSLWSIAADHLPASAAPAAVARSWPRWYGANRAVIGADPNLLSPGEVLVTPSASSSPATELP